MKRKFHQDRRGAGMVTVLVAMFVILAMGATLLFTSVTGMQIKDTDRNSVENFYDADTLLSVFRASLQEAATDSISIAYSTVLNNYAKTAATAGDDLQAKLTESFESAFVEAFFQYKTTFGNQSIPMFTNTRDINDEQDGWLDNLLDTLGCGDQLTITTDHVTVNSSNKEIVINNVKIAYTNGDYKTVLSTDLVVKYPPFSYTPGNPDPTDFLGSVALVANGGLKCWGTTEITGNIYVGDNSVDKGGVQVIGANNVLKYDGRMIVGSKSSGIQVSGGGKFTASGGSIWTPGIEVEGNGTENGSSFSVNGNLYVADDLNITGNMAAVKLEGAYSGFGYDNAADKDQDPAKNSSIVISGLNAALDLSGLKQLQLSGVSFIQDEKDQNLKKKMGQSLATKGDQLAYLVPSEYMVYKVTDEGKTKEIHTTNPNISASSDKFSEAAKTDILTNWVAKEPELFAGLNPALRSFIQKKGSNSESVEFLFVEFPSVSETNEFFRRYCEQHPEKIAEYAGHYLDLKSYQAVQNPNLSTAGNIYGTMTENDIQVLGSNQPDYAMATYYATLYSRLCRTMMDNVELTDSTIQNPYQFYVDETEISNLTETENLFKFDGKIVALLYKKSEPLSLDAYLTNYPDLQMIICTGDVNLNTTTYKGLLIANGTVSLSSGSIKRDLANTSEDVNIANVLDSTCIGDSQIKFLDLLRNSMEDNGSGTQSKNAASWDIEELVTYRNWSKNNVS